MHPKSFIARFRAVCVLVPGLRCDAPETILAPVKVLSVEREANTPRFDMPAVE